MTRRRRRSMQLRPQLEGVKLWEQREHSEGGGELSCVDRRCIGHTGDLEE